VKKAMTNDMGEFRLFGLTYALYLVSGGYGDRDRAAAIGKTQLSANVSKADDGYATVFFDGAEDLTRARAARLAPGADPGALNIFLRDSARFKIRGQVLPVVSGTRIVLAPKGSDLADADYFIQPDASGAFEIRGISPGAYLLLATAADDALSSEVVGVTVVDRDIDRVPLTLQETVSVSGQLILESAARGAARPSLSDVRIRLLRSSIEFDQKIDAAVDPDGRFTLRPVVPLAEYDIVVDPLPAGTYVRSITSGGVNILRGNARLLPFQPLRIALAPADEALEVHVYNGADAVAGAQVVLVPDILMRRRADRYVVGFTGAGGNASLAAVAPGRYTAYAFEKLEPGAYYALGYDPAAANRFADHAVPVIVGEGGTRPIQLRVIPAAETAGGFQ
jgi:hypothetical protein